MLLETPNLQPLEFVQGNTAVLEFVATDDQGNPQNLTGASFSTQILGANGVGPVVFPNGQHSIVSASAGTFSLSLAATDTPNCGLGLHKEILTTITIGGVIQTYRGVNILTVYNDVPAQ